MLTETRLVWRFNRGCRDALREIYERHKVDLVTLATALLADKTDAEDVVHDVFLRFARSTGKFRLTGSLKGFLATCVANGARNRNLAGRRRAGHEGDPSDAPAPDCQRPDWAAVFGDDLRRVGLALAALPYEQREAVLLHLRSGLTFRAIAEVQAVSINTVQGRFRYGLDKLRALLDGETFPCEQPKTLPK
ncbi:MAG TPA: RNA polymerase sigma factor [Verrucomicrobiota bacterium]|nr:RNA polymerase sigma factor [Verrucomicrobiota bacterium]HNU50329.1 RNA polymerase sigma factor [Verrucomicrobiota bacterium]